MFVQSVQQCDVRFGCRCQRNVCEWNSYARIRHANGQKIYIYSFGSNSWSSQATSSAPSNFGNSRSASILDHDTNVIFTLTSGSGASLYQLDMSSVQATASSSAIAWESVTAPSFSTDGYIPTAAQASNHINYFGVPGTAAGSADLFIVHFAQFQPAAQTYPTVGGGATFPDQVGQAISVPNSGDAPPYQIVFVPNDFSNSYVVTHWTDPGDFTKTDSAPMAQNLINSTQILPAPTSKDPLAAYAASPNSLVQIDSKGDIYAIPNAYTTSFTVSNGPSWNKLSYSLAGLSGGSSVSSSAASASGSGASRSAGSASATGSGAASGTSAGASGASAAAGSSAAAQPSSAASLTAGSARLDLAGFALGLITIGAAALF